MVSGSPRPSTPPPARPPILGHSHRSGPRLQAPLLRAWEAWEARGAWGGSGVPATVHPGTEGCPGPPCPTLDLFSAPSPRAETTPRRPRAPRALPDACQTPTGRWRPGQVARGRDRALEGHRASHRDCHDSQRAPGEPAGPHLRSATLRAPLPPQLRGALAAPP